MNLTQLGISSDIQVCLDSVNGSCVKKTYSLALRVPMYLIFSMTILLIVCGNLLVICTIASSQKLRTPTNYLIVSLAAADLLLGLFVMPLSMVRYLETCWYFGSFLCKFHSSVDFTLCNSSVLHLVCISLDRYYVVCQPLHYQSKVTFWTALAMIAASWTLSVIFGFSVNFFSLKVKVEDFLHVDCKGGCLGLHDKEIGVAYSLVFFFMPVTVIISVYVRIFVIAHRHTHAIHAMMQRGPTTGLVVRKLDMKATKTLAIVIGVFLCCWTPFFICNIIDPIIGHKIPQLLYEVLMWVAYLNSLFNPVVYAFFSQWFKEASTKLLNSLFKPDGH